MCIEVVHDKLLWVFPSELNIYHAAELKQERERLNQLHSQEMAQVEHEGVFKKPRAIDHCGCKQMGT